MDNPIKYAFVVFLYQWSSPGLTFQGRDVLQALESAYRGSGDPLHCHLDKTDIDKHQKLSCTKLCLMWYCGYAIKKKKDKPEGTTQRWTAPLSLVATYDWTD